jgi:hypothetical protein
VADFVSLAAAEIRAYAKVADGTWIEAHAARHTTNGKFCVRVIRKMSPTHPDYGAWTEIDQDNQV